MPLTKYRLGDLIVQSLEKNQKSEYVLDDVKGLSVNKVFIETKADMKGVSLKPYLIVNPKYFAYVTVTSRNSEKITLAYNRGKETYIVSSSYVVFKVSQEEILLPEYLYIYFNRPEFDRYSRFNSWGSARETFTWDDMCDIEIELPSIEIQQKYVDVYNAMLENQKAYETGLEDLKLVCDGYVENLKKKPGLLRPLFGLIEEKNVRNIDSIETNIEGVGSGSLFIDTKANTHGLNLSNYKVVNEKDFAYNPSRINIGSIAMRLEGTCIVSPMYIIFKVVDEHITSSDYLMLWFERKEFQRSTLFYATGSVRDTFSFDLMQESKVPIPDIKTQQSIANIYKVYKERTSINERLKAQIKYICPILIKGSIDEAKRQKGE